jgi:hypothetical protein
MSDDLPTGVTVTSDRNSISASIDVDASAAVAFDLICRPADHPAISGDGTVKGTRVGPDKLGAIGETFGMSMKLFGLPYRISSTVKEFEPGRSIAWAHFGGHRWRWQVQPTGDDTCRVTETFDLSTSRGAAGLRLAGFPARHRDNVARSVANLAKLAAAEAAAG